MKMNDLVFIKDNHTLTSSKIIAEMFKKRHADVLRAIKNIDASKEFFERNFAPIDNQAVTHSPAVNNKEYAMNRDGFMFLVMGFTGREAALIKEKFIYAFNEMEVELRSQLPAPKSPTEIILFAAQQLHEQSLRMDNIEEKVRVIEASKETNDGGYVAIMGYARIVNKPIDVGTAAKLGRKAKSICSTLGYEVFSVSDPRFGRVNTYPKEVLETVFNEYFA